MIKGLTIHASIQAGLNDFKKMLVSAKVNRLAFVYISFPEPFISF